MRTEGVASDFSFESVLFESDRVPKPIELSPSVTDLDIFEHLNKPYLTAILAFTDSRNFISGTDVLGAEKITIRLRSNRKNSKQIVKTFYIDKIKVNHKINDNNQYTIFHLIEDIGYTANLQNVNRPYSDKCSNIISKIAQNYLGKEVFTTANDKQAIKVIIPNLNPLQAIKWISSRATTVQGYPFFITSTLVGDKLKFVDLGSLLEQPTINKDVPYRYWQGASNHEDRDIQRRTIRGYEQNDTEDLFTLIRRGLVGSDYQYIDTLKNNKNKFHFDVTKDLLQPIVKAGLLKGQPNVMYSPDYTYDEKSFNEYASRMITRVGGSSAHETVNSYAESDNVGEYKLNVISNAMFEFLKKAPIQVDLQGIDFIDGDVNTATGNNIQLDFLRSLPEDTSEGELDTKKSGNYLVFATQYMFKREACNVRLSCVKLGNQRL